MDDYPSNMNHCARCNISWGTAPGGTPPSGYCPHCGSAEHVTVNV